MPDTDPRDAWLRRVLGVVPQGATDGQSAATWREAVETWRAASEEVDAQITELRRYLLATGDEDFKDIAEFGLNAMTAGHKTELQAAILSIDAGSAASIAAGRPRALKAVDTFAAFLDSDRRVRACDSNHFGVAVSIRGTLAPALSAMRAAMTEAEVVAP